MCLKVNDIYKLISKLKEKILRLLLFSYHTNILFDTTYDYVKFNYLKPRMLCHPEKKY